MVLAQGGNMVVMQGVNMVVKQGGGGTWFWRKRGTWL